MQTASNQITKYFTKSSSDQVSSNVKWSHATNNQELLSKALKSSDVDMIEIDVVVGTMITGGPLKLPILAHPPNVTSDVSLESLIHQMIDFTQCTNTHPKGIKLDFKSTEALEKSFPILRNLRTEMKFPIWINADIIKGPSTNNEPVNAKVFFEGTKEFKDAILSLGWTTGCSLNITERCYTHEQVDEMICSIINEQVMNPLTFPVRACLLNTPEPMDHLFKTLTKSNHQVTFTIWSSPNDPVSIDNLRNFISHFGADKCFLDLSEDLIKRLKLDELM